MSTKALVPIAHGTEEIEAVCIIDTLRRADIDVTVASVNDDLQITASRGVKLVADCHIDDCKTILYDLIVLPGGVKGAENLRDSKVLFEILKKHDENGKITGAICAAPALVLEQHKLLSNRMATAHPDFYRFLTNPADTDQRVVIDGTVVTSRGPGTAIEFAITLIQILLGEEKARSIANYMLVKL